jgi:hypothetical protein
MAGGGLMQLVAYGAQDVYLTGNPQITFFKVVYRRHTNFSTEAIEQTINGSVAASSRVTVTIARNGDLVGRTYLDVNTGTVNKANYGHAMIDNVVLEIGGQQVDKHFGHWMETWAELTEPNANGQTYAPAANMAVTQGGTPVLATKFQRMAAAGGCTQTNVDLGHIFVPLQFSFCRNPGLALPLIALQYHEVKLNLTLSADYGSGASGLKVFCDYHYLDTDERRRFAQVSHEYLIEQVQYQSASNSTSNELNFNHPVKELVWTDAYAAGDFSGNEVVTGGNWHLKLNGHDRFAAREYRYFTRAQVWQHHTGYGSVMGEDQIAVYSFGLKPEEHQPSGTCNFSRIDNSRLISSTAPGGSFNVYAVNYNVLRIMSGMGGLAYSN